MGLFIDILKAFDSINHIILIDKLYGFTSTAYSLFSSHLSLRFQYIELNGIKSELSKISCEVPQGSILGPLLLLLYNNDLTNITNKLHFTLLGDDATILLANSSLKYCT